MLEFLKFLNDQNIADKTIAHNLLRASCHLIDSSYKLQQVTTLV